MIPVIETYCCFLAYEDYIYHTIVAKASGELCQKYLFYMGPFTRKSLLQRSAPLPLSLIFPSFPCDIYGMYIMLVVNH
jgi:membrane-associated protease RseP (regulator of RpoE activity)